MAAYYNEHDPKAAAWLRELIKEGLIADGEVDERSITDVEPIDVIRFTQCHWFAGIGGWSHALRLAGWSDDRHVWTGSCPCQPFSSAGAQVGGDDPRHLWPAWFRLIRECRPDVLFGEQVEAAVNHGWLDLVCDDLEREGYAAGAVSLPAASVGAPHIRQRVWFVADAERRAAERHGLTMDGTPSGAQIAAQERQRVWVDARDGGIVGELAQSHRTGWDRGRAEEGPLAATSLTRFPGAPISDMGDTKRRRCEGWNKDGARADEPRTARSIGGSWHHADFIPCGDGVMRPVEPGTFPLAHGIPARVGRLRGYGNAIVPQVAAEVIRAYMEIVDGR